MAIDPILQAKIEKDLVWKRYWPRCFLSLITSLEILLGVVIFLTELLNIAMGFWRTNIFGGFWASIMILINWISIYVTICCTQTIGAATCALIWNLLTLLALAILIIFDVIFILNPTTCILTPNCASQPEVFSLNFIMQLIPAFKNYSTYDSKKFFLTIQVCCAGGAFVISALYILIYIICRSRMNGRIVQESRVPTAPMAPPQSPPNYPPQQFPYAPDLAIVRPTPLYPELAAN